MIKNNQKGIADCFHYLGSISWQQAKYNEALVSFKEALKLRRQYSNWNDIAATQRNIALVHKDQSDYEKITRVPEYGNEHIH